MPLYEYQCRACGHRFEKIQKFSDPPLAECPECGGEVEKLVSAPAFQFKGDGWYITDYARKDSGDKAGKKGKGEASDSESSSKSDAKASKGDESKSDTSSKTETKKAPDKPAGKSAD